MHPTVSIISPILITFNHELLIVFYLLLLYIELVKFKKFYNKLEY